MEYVHRLPGRLRVRCNALKRNPKKGSELLTVIGALPGVRDVDVNLATGSVLVHYDPLRLSAEEIIATLRGQGMMGAEPITRPATPDRSLGGTVAKAVFTTVLQHAIEQSIVRLIPMLL